MNSAEKTHNRSMELELYMSLLANPKNLQVLWLKDLEFCFEREVVLRFIVYLIALESDTITYQCFEILLVLGK